MVMEKTVQSNECLDDVLVEARYTFTGSDHYYKRQREAKEGLDSLALLDYEMIESEIKYFRKRFSVPGTVWGADFLENENVPEKIRDYCRSKATLLMERMVAKCDWYRAKYLAQFLNDYGLIMAHIREFGISSWGERKQAYVPYYDLFKTVLARGNGRQINRAMEVYFSQFRGNSFVDAAGILGFGESRLADVILRTRENLRDYVRINGIEQKAGISPFHVHAAMEISKMDYDLIAGIYRGCTSLTTPLEVISDNVRYIDYSRTRAPEIDPKWHAVGRMQGVANRADKILVCEDDSVSGGSLRRVIPLLEELEPRRVDICFSGYNLDASYHNALTIPYYKIVSGMRVSFDSFVGNLRAFDAKLKRVLRKMG